MVVTLGQPAFLGGGTMNMPDILDKAFRFGLDVSMNVDLQSDPGICMAEQLLDRLDVLAVRVQLRSNRVTEGVPANNLG